MTGESLFEIGIKQELEEDRMKGRKSVFDCKVELEEFPAPKVPFPDGIGYGLTQDEKASLRMIRLEREIIRTKQKLIELNQELDDLVEEMIFLE